MNTSQHDAWTQPERKTPKITTHIQDDLNDRLYTEPSVNTKSRDGRGLSLVSQLRENDRQCIHVTRRRSFVEKLLDCFTCNAIEGGVHLVPQLLLFVSCIWNVTCFGFVGFACSHDKIQAHKVLEEMDALFLSLFLVLIRTGRKCWTDIAIHDMVSISVYACHLKWRLSSFDTWRFCMSFVWQMWRFSENRITVMGMVMLGHKVPPKPVHCPYHSSEVCCWAPVRVNKWRLGLTTLVACLTDASGRRQLNDWTAVDLSVPSKNLDL